MERLGGGVLAGRPQWWTAGTDPRPTVVRTQPLCSGLFTNTVDSTDSGAMQAQAKRTPT